jgi:hypothetical protein
MTSFILILMRKLKVSSFQAMEILDISIEERQMYLEKIE